VTVLNGAAAVCAVLALKLAMASLPLSMPNSTCKVHRAAGPCSGHINEEVQRWLTHILYAEHACTSRSSKPAATTVWLLLRQELL
jgi:hypothetical protein